MKTPKAGKLKILARCFGKAFVLRKFQVKGRGVVEWAFLRSSSRGNVVVFAITSDEKVVAIDTFRYAVKGWVLELPGGGREAGQTLKEAVVDELKNEAGYSCNKRNISRLCRQQVLFEPAALTAYYVPFLALNCTRIKGWRPKRDHEEIIRNVATIPLDRWTPQLLKAKTVDDKTLAVTLLVEHYFKARKKR